MTMIERRFSVYLLFNSFFEPKPTLYNMPLSKTKFLIISVIILSNLTSLAQSKSNKGKEFWIGFMSHIEGTDAGMSLYITSDSNTTGTVSIPGQNWSTSYTVSANSLTVVNVPVSDAYINCSDCIQSKGVKVVSDDDVVVYAHHYEGNKSDATLVLPTRTLGKDYFLMSWQESSQNAGFGGSYGKNVFSVVAVKDGTKVNITPSSALIKSGGGTRAANATYQITLNEGQVYHAIANSNTGDLTGTRVEVIDTGALANCRTVAVFSGSTYTRVGGCNSGFGINSGDNLLEQMFPTNSWGEQFVLVPALGRTGDSYRFVASQNNTRIVVFKSGAAPDIAYINEGDYYEVTAENNVRSVLTDKPVLAAQFQRTSKCDGNNNVGDPSMTILNPLEQTLTNITVYSSEYYDIDNHYINVTMPTYATSTFRIDGNTASFTSVPTNSYYSYTRLSVSKGNHRLTADVGFIATAYGEGQYESYGYAAGANVKDLTAVASVSNSTQLNVTSGCIGRPTQFIGSAEYSVVRWEWDFGDGSIDSVQNPSHIYSDTGTFQAKLYTYKPTFDGCSNYDSAFVEVRIFAKPEARLSRSSLCDSVVAFFADSSIMPQGEQKLSTLWYFPGAAIKYGNSAAHRFDTTGKFEVMMEVYTENYCTDTFLDSLFVNPLPEPSFSVENVCFNDSISLVSNSSTSVGNLVKWEWEFSNNTSDSVENPTVWFADSGFHSAALTVHSDSGCFDTYVASFYKYPRIESSFSYNDTCLGFGQPFTNTTLLDGGTFTDTLWYTSIGETANTFNYTDTFANPGSYLVTLVMEQDSFCRDTFSRLVNVHPLALAAFDFTNTCLGDSTEFIDMSSVATGSYTKSWNFGNGNTATSDNPKQEFAAGGEQTVTLTITTDQGCQTDSTRTILITYPSITAINVQDICEGDSLILTADTVRGLDSFSTYRWTYGTTISNSPTIRTTYNELGKSIVNLQVRTKNGCQITAQDSFITEAKPKPNFLVTSVCEGLEISPVENSSISAPAVITNYAWYLNDLWVSNDRNPEINTTTAGSGNIKLIATADNGCLDSIQKLAVIHPLPVASYTSANMCLGDVNTLTSTSSIATGSIPSLYWTIDGIDYTSAIVNPPFTTDGSYEVRLIAESDNNCSDTLTNQVDVHPLPELSFVIPADSGCVPFEVQLQNNSSINSGSITSFSFKWGDGSDPSLDSNHIYTRVGSYTIQVVGESDFGCKDSIDVMQQITVLNNPTADFNFNPTDPSTLTEFVTFKDSSKGNISDWNWEVSDGASYNGSKVYHPFADSGTYAITLFVEDEFGCTHDTTKLVYVNADLLVYIPNSFTPNGDGLNDEFGLGGLTAGVSQMVMDVYNRWGEKIFSSQDVNNRWDGTVKGEPVQQGVYVYMVKFTNPKQTKWYYLNGEIHLLRK